MQVSELCPDYVGRRNIILQLARTGVVLANRPTVVLVSLDGEALVSGLLLPLELRIVAPHAVNFRQHFYSGRVVPTSFAFTPREAGEHLISLREVAHNRWSGSLLVQVKGTTFEG